MISTANLTIQFGPKPLFENVSVTAWSGPVLSRFSPPGPAPVVFVRGLLHYRVSQARLRPAPFGTFISRSRHVISTANLTIQFGPKPLFENVSVKFGEGNATG